jgi:quercetin dioxygenase-like cupin family protein
MTGTEADRSEMDPLHVPPDGGGSLWFFGELVTCKVTSDQTGGAYSLFEIVARPGAGPPPHVQHWEDEAAYVLEGDYEFVAEGASMRAGPGSLVYVSRGRLHTYKNVGGKPGRMLVVQTPGGLYERLLEDAGGATEPHGQGIARTTSDFERIAKSAARYGIEIPPPKGSKDERA